MRKVFALTLLILPSACASVGPQASQPGRTTIAGAMNAPIVLQAQQTRQAPDTEARPVEVRPVETPAPRTVYRSAPPRSDIQVTKWGATVDYDHSIDRPDMLASVTRNQDTSRPAFATLKRSFGSGEFRPYIGVGVGQASAKFGALDPGTQEGYAVKGVLGGNLFFTEEVGGYVQYDYAVAAENPALAENDKSHGISLGLSISLN